jgi:hypothetical protein
LKNTQGESERRHYSRSKTINAGQLMVQNVTAEDAENRESRYNLLMTIRQTQKQEYYGNIARNVVAGNVQM